MPEVNAVQHEETRASASDLQTYRQAAPVAELDCEPMHSLAPEILVLRGEGVVDAAALEQPLALEERRVFSLQVELRVALYAGVAAVLAGVGLLIRNNLDRIGPVALLGGILLSALIHGYNSLVNFL